MEKQQFIEAIKSISESKRGFKQTYELIINLRDIDLKKPDNHVDAFITLPHERGKTIKICALVGGELAEQAKKTCDNVIISSDFAKYEGNKKELKKLAGDYDFFIAQANLMANIAKVFGRVFGPRNKMPNPKAGCVVPPNATLAPLIQKLKKTVRIIAKTQASIKVPVGIQGMDEDKIAENMRAVYTAAIPELPQEINNIKSVMIKLTMSKPVTVGAKEVKE